MFKVKTDDEIVKSSSLETDVSEKFYSVVEVSVSDILFHINLTYGAVGCCDDGCGIKTRIISADIEKALEIVNVNVVLDADVFIQIPEFNGNKITYKLIYAKEIFSGTDLNGKEVYFCKTSEEEVFAINAKSDFNSLKNKKLRFKKGKTFYWKEK